LIVYLDTSAVIPILIAEPTTDACRRIWDDADRRISSRLTYVEVAAELAMAERQGRISSVEQDEALSKLAEMWPDVDVVEATAELATSAAEIARSLALRGYDAVHCASAAEVNDPELVAATGDARLLAAWRELGIAVFDTHTTPIIDIM
jgi:predicted nucleic acid-binding protein